MEERTYKIIHIDKDVNRQKYEAINRHKLRAGLIQSDETISQLSKEDLKLNKINDFVVSLIERLLISYIDT